ncbi:uncharacterized protein LOC143928156 [Lithobates pipiens]
MKTFIFTFFLLAGHSFWETKAQASSGLACLLKSADKVPEVLTDFVGLVCALTNENIPVDERVAKLKAFLDKYTEPVADCDIIEVLGVKPANLRDVTTESAADIVKTVLETLGNWGLTNNVMQILCDPTACVAKIIGELTQRLLKKNKGILAVVKCEDLDTLIDTLIEDFCIPDKDLGDIANILKRFLRGRVLDNVKIKALLKGVCAVTNILLA